MKPPLPNIEEDLLACQKKDLINFDNKLTDKAEAILTDCEEYFKKSKVKVTSAALGENYQEKVKAYREIFPTGQHPTLGYTFRSSVEDLTPRFTWFFSKYPEFSWELVLQATYAFVQKAQQNNYRGLGKANYFIKKTDKETNTVTSPLADMCQDVLDGAVAPAVPDFYVTYEERNL